MGFPKRIAELPNGEFYAILTPESVTIPADERSKQCPGHGYPEHSVDYWRMETFSDRAKWEAEIIRLATPTSYGKREFKAVIVKPVEVKTTFTVEI